MNSKHRGPAHATIVIAVEPRGRNPMFASKMAPPMFGKGPKKGAKGVAKKPADDEEEDFSLFEDEPADEEMDESEEGEEAVEGDEESEPVDLAAASDDELLAEVKKRKLRI